MLLEVSARHEDENVQRTAGSETIRKTNMKGPIDITPAEQTLLMEASVKQVILDD